MITTFLSLFLLATPAEAKVTFTTDCVPNAPLESPMIVGWNSLLKIHSLRSVVTMDAENLTSTLEIRSSVRGVYSKEVQELTHRYVKQGLEEHFRPESVPTLRYDAVVFTINKEDLPTDSEPVRPGVYRAWTTLILVSSYRENKITGTDVRKIEMTCEYSGKGEE
jgi:hypothetical protein